LLIPGAERGRSREFRDGLRRGGQPGEAVELDKLMAVGRENELDVEALALGVPFGLVETVTRWKAFLLGLDKCQGDGLRIDVDLYPQDIVDLSARTPPRLAADDLPCLLSLHAE